MGICGGTEVFGLGARGAAFSLLGSGASSGRLICCFCLRLSGGHTPSNFSFRAARIVRSGRSAAYTSYSLSESLLSQ